METLLDTPEEEMLYGWYYRPGAQRYEFWWEYQNLVAVHEEMLGAMPTYLAAEIVNAATAKSYLE